MINNSNPTICTTYSHDFLGRDMLIECNALDCDFLAPVRSLPDFATTTSCHDILRINDFVLYQQFRR